LAYGSSDEVKERLKITGSSEDTYIGHLIAQADAEIDVALKSYTSVPLSPVPEAVKQISTDLACGLFWENRQNTQSIFCVRARAALQNYILQTYFPKAYSDSLPVIESGI